MVSGGWRKSYTTYEKKSILYMRDHYLTLVNIHACLYSDFLCASVCIKGSCYEWIWYQLMQKIFLLCSCGRWKNNQIEKGMYSVIITCIYSPQNHIYRVSTWELGVPVKEISYKQSNIAYCTLECVLQARTQIKNSYSHSEVKKCVTAQKCAGGPVA